eukprot:TRINITY_DN683_c0_g1_i3.p1 TRINITY_DN683_c0_g1~~TRINITY_DN683_c0_g1_i3.p1  ORF type:complete len:425 (+),score=207.84 TRINITY_DN683_c0_g1_i3:74-1348(+)
MPQQQERRVDVTCPGSTKTYTREQFVSFYGKAQGAKMWASGGKAAAAKAERRRDPTDPKSKKTYTKEKFLEFYGQKQGTAMWKKAAPKDAAKPAEKPVVLVTSATGRIGKEVVARLAKSKKFVVRAAAHNPEKADYLKKLGAKEIIAFDYTDPETWGPALKKVSYVYSASLDPLLSHHLKFCEFLGKKRKQLKLVVRVSCMGADTNTASYDKDKHVTRDGAEIPLMLQHYWWGEKALLDAKVPTCVLRANFFMNHLLKTDCDNIKEHGFFSNPLGKARNSFVCTNDIGEAAAQVLKDNASGACSHRKKFYDITGPAPQSMDEIAADLSKAMDKEIKYKAQSMTDFEKDFGPVRAGFFEYLTNGFYTRCSPDFYNLTGRKPTSYAEYLAGKGASGETGLEELWQANLWKKGQDAMKDAAKAVAAK